MFLSDLQLLIKCGNHFCLMYREQPEVFNLLYSFIDSYCWHSLNVWCISMYLQKCFVSCKSSIFILFFTILFFTYFTIFCREGGGFFVTLLPVN